MNIRRINEAFKRIYEDSTPVLTADDDLRTALMDEVYRLMAKGGYIKEFEIAFQDVIERFYPDKAWWEVCDVDIFNHLFTSRDPEETVDAIVASIQDKESTQESLKESLNLNEAKNIINVLNKNLRVRFKHSAGGIFSLDRTSFNEDTFNKLIKNNYKMIGDILEEQGLKHDISEDAYISKDTNLYVTIYGDTNGIIVQFEEMESESLKESVNSDIVSTIKKQFPKATVKTSVRKHSDVHKSNPDTPVGKTKYVDIRITPDSAASVNSILQYCNHNIKKVLDSDNRFYYYGDVPARNPRGGKEVVLSYQDYSGLSDDEYRSLLGESVNPADLTDCPAEGEFSWNHFSLKQGDLVDNDYDYDREEGTSEYEIIDTISNSVIGYAKVFYDNEDHANVYKLKFNTPDIPDKIRRMDFAGNYPLEYSDDLSSYCKWLDSELHKRLNESLKESTYSDYGGIMGEPGEQYTDADLKVYWDRNNANDPVLNAYNGNYDAWFKDTISNMDRVNEAIMRRLEAYVSNLNEAEMSDEDKHDSELIRSMIQKMQTRSNAAFTPEEKAVMTKYGITRNNWRKKLTVADRELNPDIDSNSRTYYRGGGYSNGTPSKINYADRARKLPARKQNQIAGDGSATYYQNAHYNAHGYGGGIQNAERGIRNAQMQEPINAMRTALQQRRIAQQSIDGAEAARERRMAAAQAQYDKAKRDADWWYDQDTVASARSRDWAQSEIDSLLKKKK